MNSRGIHQYPSRRGQVRRRKVQRPRSLWGRIPDIGKIVIIAVGTVAISFGAVFFNLPKLVLGSSPMSRDDVRAIIQQFAGKVPAPSREKTDSMAKGIAFVSSKSNSAQIQLDGTAVQLQAPAGHCYLNASQRSDARLLGVLNKIFRAEIRLVGAHADCAQLVQWRGGKRKTLGDYGDFLVPVMLIGKTAKAGDTRSFIDAACGAMREYKGEFQGVHQSGLKQRFEKALENSRLNEVRLVGVIDQDDHACYFSTLQKIMAEDGTKKTQVNVATIALIGGKMLYMNLYSVLKSDETMAKLLKRQKVNVALNVTANGG